MSKHLFIIWFYILIISCTINAQTTQEQPTITPIKVFPYNLREPVSISCEARGFPVPNVTWFNPDGSPVPSSMVINRGSSQDSRTTSLVISGIQYNQIGNYTCVAENFERTQQTVFVEVIGAPVVDSSQNITYIPSTATNVTFVCTFVGNPAPRILGWTFLNESNIPQNSQFQIGNSKRVSSYRVTSSLKAYGARCSGFYLNNFRCSAENSYSPDPVVNDGFAVGFNASSLIVPESEMDCSSAHEFCRSRGMRLAVIPTRRILTSIYDLFENSVRRDFWISNISVHFLSEEFVNATDNDCVKVKSPVTSSSSHLSLRDGPSIPVCEKPKKIQPKINLVSSVRNTCNGSTLEVSWEPLPGSADISHQIYVNGTERHVVEAGLSSTTITGLTSRTSYNIQVKPLFYGCQFDQPFYPNVMETGRGFVPPPVLTTLIQYNPSLEKCTVTWEYANGSMILEPEIGMFLVRISELMRGLSENEAITNQTVASVGKSQSKSYDFGVAPNSVYKVEIGFSASEPCQNILKPSWTEPISGDCTTPVAVPQSIPLSSLPPSNANGMITLTLQSVSQRNGPISCFIVVLQRQRDEIIPDKLEDPNQIQANNPDTYIAFASPSFSGSIEFPLGDNRKTCCDVTMMGQEANCSSATSSRRKKRDVENQIKGDNQPLASNTSYSYYVITSTPSDNGPLFASSDRSRPFSSNIIPQSYTGIIVGVVVGVTVAVILIILFVFLYRRYQLAKRQQATDNDIYQNLELNPEVAIKPTEPEDEVSDECSSPLPERVETSSHVVEENPTSISEPTNMETTSHEPKEDETSISEPAKIETSSDEPEEDETSINEPAKIETSSNEPEEDETSINEPAKIETSSPE